MKIDYVMFSEENLVFLIFSTGVFRYKLQITILKAKKQKVF